MARVGFLINVISGWIKANSFFSLLDESGNNIVDESGNRIGSRNG